MVAYVKQPAIENPVRRKSLDAWYRARWPTTTPESRFACLSISIRMVAYRRPCKMRVLALPHSGLWRLAEMPRLDRLAERMKTATIGEIERVRSLCRRPPKGAADGRNDHSQSRT